MPVGLQVSVKDVITPVLGMILSTFDVGYSVAHTLPSGPAATEPKLLLVSPLVYEYSVTTPAVVILATCLFSASQTLPSGPSARPSYDATSPLGIGCWTTVPLVVMTSIAARPGLPA